jgi:hypothetical protein
MTLTVRRPQLYAAMAGLALGLIWIVLLGL